MKLPAISNGQAQIIIGVIGIGIALYAVYQTKETLKQGGAAVKQALDPTDANNLASKGARGLLGEDFVIDKIGGGVDTVMGWFGKGTKADADAAQKAMINRYDSQLTKPVLKPVETGKGWGVLKPEYVKIAQEVKK